MGSGGQVYISQRVWAWHYFFVRNSVNGLQFGSTGGMCDTIRLF